MKDLTGFISPCGTAYEWEYPYYGIANGRPFYHMRGRIFPDDWPMPECPFPARSDYPHRWRGNWADAQEASFAEDEQVRQLVEEQGPGFQERQIHNDSR